MFMLLGKILTNQTNNVETREQEGCDLIKYLIVAFRKYVFFGGGVVLKC